MNIKALNEAVEEAHRFLKKVDELPPIEPYPEDHPMAGYVMDNFPKQTGAIRRASLDLTRALAKFRNTP